MNDEDRPDLLFNQSLEKGLAVLSAFGAQRRTMTLADVAAATGMSKSSAQRMVHTLESLGLVRKHEVTRRYQLTPRVMQIACNYLAANALVEVAMPYLSELTRTTGETSNLTEPDGQDMVYVARFVTAKFVPIHMPIGSRIPMYCTSSGRAYLSALPQPEAEELLAKSQIVRHTEHTVVDIDDLRQRLVAARRRGYATNREEMFLGDMTLGAPVLNAQGRPIGAVHVLAPTSRWTLADAEQRLAPAVIECARAISSSARALG